MKRKRMNRTKDKQSQSESATHLLDFAELDAYLFPGKRRYRHRVIGARVGADVAKKRLAELQKDLVS